MTEKSKKSVSRRAFLGTTAAVAAGITIVPSHAVAGLGHKAPSDKLNIAAVGIGGMGASNLRNLKSENIVGLCDVDWKYAKKTFDT
ncbi:MAG: twin-arginine translocation signal domain-containing protein, partial [Draconibacterium sp.]|nr:twin-arginine translocation signal domain-containing protein [Draconibacterium sp.]